MSGKQHIPSAHVPGMRQDERRNQHEYQEGNDQSPCTRLDFASDPSLRRFDIIPEVVELALVASAFTHRVHPSGCTAAADCPTPGMPRPTPLGRCPPA